MNVKIALPKGRLWDETYSLLVKSGIDLGNSEKNYTPNSNMENVSFYIIKPRNIPKMVESGIFDMGIVGNDLVIDEKADVHLSMDLKTMPVYLIVGGKKGSMSKDKNTVATEYTGIAMKYFNEKGKDYEILKTYGSTECFVPEFADVIVDHIQTGSTLKANNLSVLEIIMKSTTHLIENKNMCGKKKEIAQKVKELLAKGLLEMDLSYDGFLSENQIRNNDF